MLRSTLRTALALPLLATLACGAPPAPDAEPAAGPRTENSELGLALASVPTGFTVETNEGAALALARSDGMPGTMTVAASPPQTAGINLVEATRIHKQEILEKDGGRYNGTLELGTHLGTAFQSRGRYENPDGSMTEDFRVFVVHPSGDRLLSLEYVYPAGLDKEERQAHLFEVLGEIEPLG